MRWLNGTLQWTTGLAYFVSVALLSGIELWNRRKEDVRTFPWTDRLLLYGLIGMALSCGPHHLDLGIHMLFYDHPASPVDTAAILVALPFGLIWTWFRLGQVFPYPDPDKRPKWYPVADWRIAGTEQWPMTLLGALIGYCAAIMMTTSMLVFTSPDLHLAANHPLTYLPQIVLLFLYFIVGYLLWTPLIKASTRPGGTWSLASLSLAVIFPTCAMTHWSYGTAVARGAYPVNDWHGAIIDLYGIPAACFFLWVAYRRRNLLPPIDRPLRQLIEAFMTDPEHDDLMDLGIEAVNEADDLKTMLLKTNRNFTRFARIVKRQRRINLAIIVTFTVDFLVTIVSVLALVSANNTQHDFQEQVVAECVRANAAGQANIDLWEDTIKKADPANRPDATDEEIATWNDPTQVRFREQFVADLNKKFGPVDC